MDPCDGDADLFLGLDLSRFQPKMYLQSVDASESIRPGIWGLIRAPSGTRALPPLQIVSLSYPIYAKIDRYATTMVVRKKYGHRKIPLMFKRWPNVSR